MRAIASYERTQFSLQSPFDGFIPGDKDAISESAGRGWNLFNTAKRMMSLMMVGPNGFEPSTSSVSIYHGCEREGL